MSGNQIDSLVDLVQQGLLLLYHVTLHLPAEVLGSPLGYLFDLCLP